MNDKPSPVLDDDAHAPPPNGARQIMDDLTESEADDAAGRTDTGTELLAEMDRAVARIRAKIGRRGA